MLINLREQSVLEVFVWIYLYKEIIFYVSFVNERSNKCHLAGNYMFKVNSRNTRNSNNIVNFKHISHFVLVFLMLTLNM